MSWPSADTRRPLSDRFLSLVVLVAAALISWWCQTMPPRPDWLWMAALPLTAAFVASRSLGGDGTVQLTPRAAIVFSTAFLAAQVGLQMATLRGILPAGGS